ncbi:hypothetical protein ROZALSC1DRAFT_28126 [Rozella allomycis CSF55]|uniref:Uncharacterized protein n=1 Tax=Rozella allomycis (strain CSF55) TaxID=988480 RepID=A0A4P9YL76_ROZAC|nr:hypothetical protein ROZALSC1DRAFT_28126 [Rozella allomycis CSF55]
MSETIQSPTPVRPNPSRITSEDEDNTDVVTEQTPALSIEESTECDDTNELNRLSPRESDDAENKRNLRSRKSVEPKENIVAEELEKKRPNDPMITLLHRIIYMKTDKPKKQHILDFSGWKEAELDSRVLHARLYRVTIPCIKDLCSLLSLDNEGSKVLKHCHNKKNELIERLIKFLSSPKPVKKTRVSLAPIPFRTPRPSSRTGRLSRADGDDIIPLTPINRKRQREELKEAPHNIEQSDNDLIILVLLIIDQSDDNLTKSDIIENLIQIGGKKPKDYYQNIVEKALITYSEE